MTNGRLWRLLALALVLSADLAWAQQARPAAVADLARSADTIVLTACDAGASRWLDEPHIIVTAHSCHVERAFKGQTDQVVTVQVLGGTVGTTGMISSGSVSLTAGADLVLMLQRSRFGDYYVVAGGAGGVLPVARRVGQRTVRGMSLDDFSHWVDAEALPR
ncbi:MAG TPA: hypothetical protein VMW17_04590 [Candidatus Binatia bacterium]|nr:hypothetical protein [Candidatus Binatia bacterium]